MIDSLLAGMNVIGFDNRQSQVKACKERWLSLKRKSDTRRLDAYMILPPLVLTHLQTVRELIECDATAIMMEEDDDDEDETEKKTAKKKQPYNCHRQIPHVFEVKETYKRCQKFKELSKFKIAVCR